MSEPTDDRDPFEVVAESFLARYRTGERPSIEEYAVRHPELADQIRKLLPALVMVEQDVTIDSDPDSKSERPLPVLSSGQERRLGDYRILREIGRGGMGVVYEAEQVSLGRRVALKVLPGQASRDRVTRERFHREARTAARLHHTNIVPVYDVGQDGDVRYYAMQFIQGMGLDAVITELQQLRERGSSQFKIKATSEGPSVGPRGEQTAQGVQATTLSEGVEVSAVLQYILTGRLDPGGQSPELVGASPSLLARALAGGLATPTGTGAQRRSAGFDPALTRTETESATAGDATDPQRPHPPAPALSPSPSPSSSSAILPGGAQLSSVESGRQAFFRSLAQIGRQVAGGLAYAHAREIVHRDIKASNLLLDTEGVVWITDFGLAKGEDEGLTHTGDILGTLRYMAPERFRGEGDARADVYALGLTLYELLTLRPGFDSPDRLKLIEQIKTEEPKKPRAIDARIPRDLETIVLKAIEKDPKARYQSAQAMGEDLGRFLADEPIKARQVSAAERYWRWARRNPVIAVLGGVLTGVLVLATLVSTYFALRANQQADEAQANARQATQEMRRANLAATKAFEETQRADLEAKRANQEAQNATKEAQNARDEKRLGDRRLYVAETNLIRLAWRDNQLQVMEKQLEALVPKRPEDADLRDFEWYYLQQQCHYLRTRLGHSRAVAGVALRPDGRQIASADSEGDVRLWDAITGQQVRTLRGHANAVRFVVYSPDGGLLASASNDHTVKLWDAATGQEVRTLRGHTSPVPCVAFRPDGRQIASVSEITDPTSRVWDVATGRQLLTLRSPTGGFSGVAYRPDGRQLATAGGDSRVRLWDGVTGQEVRAWPGHADTVLAVAYCPDGTRIASAGGDHTVKVWDVATGQRVLTLHGHAAPVVGVAFSLDGRRIASVGEDHSMKVWDVASGQEVQIRGKQAGQVWGAGYSPEGLPIDSAGNEQLVALRDAAADQMVLTLSGNGKQVIDVAFSPDGRQVASVGADRTIKLWDATTGQRLRTLHGHTEEVWSVAYSPDGRYIASASLDRTVKLWDAASGQELRTLRGHVDQVWCEAFSPDGRRIASGGVDQTVKLWDAASGQELLTLRGHATVIVGVAFSPDGRRIASGSWDHTVRLWDATSGQEILTLRGHTAGVGRVAFSPDGRRIASPSWDHTVKLWDAASGQEVLALRGHTRPVIGVAFAHDGRRLASAGWDHDVKLWDPATGQELLTLREHTSYVTGVAFSPDGRRLASASWDYTAKLWDAAPLTPELHAFREAQGVVEFLFSQSLPAPDVLKRIRRDDTLSEPVRRQALALVEPFGQDLAAREAERRVESLYGKPLLRSEVRESLRTDPSLSEPARQRTLSLAEQIPEYPERLNSASWAVVHQPGADPAAYRLALRQAEAACRLVPDRSSFLSTLGLAQYRAGNDLQAAATLKHADELNNAVHHGSSLPRDLAFLTLAQLRLGRIDAARETLGRLRGLMKDAVWAQDKEAQAFLREAEGLLLDTGFPRDPFAGPQAQ